jgi:hypothetical protein
MNYEKENNAYRLQLTELLAHEGEFAVIRGDIVLGAYDTYEDAVNAGNSPKMTIRTIFTKNILNRK